MPATISPCAKHFLFRCTSPPPSFCSTSRLSNRWRSRPASSATSNSSGPPPLGEHFSTGMNRSTRSYLARSAKSSPRWLDHPLVPAHDSHIKRITLLTTKIQCVSARQAREERARLLFLPPPPRD